jgi:hypothetical protein
MDGISPGTDEGASRIRIPSPTIATPRGISMRADGGKSF